MWPYLIKIFVNKELCLIKILHFLFLRINVKEKANETSLISFLWRLCDSLL